MFFFFLFSIRQSNIRRSRLTSSSKARFRGGVFKRVCFDPVQWSDGEVVHGTSDNKDFLELVKDHFSAFDLWEHLDPLGIDFVLGDDDRCCQGPQSVSKRDRERQMGQPCSRLRRIFGTTTFCRRWDSTRKERWYGGYISYHE